MATTYGKMGSFRHFLPELYHFGSNFDNLLLLNNFSHVDIPQYSIEKISPGLDHYLL